MVTLLDRIPQKESIYLFTILDTLLSVSGKDAAYEPQEKVRGGGGEEINAEVSAYQKTADRGRGRLDARY